MLLSQYEHYSAFLDLSTSTNKYLGVLLTDTQSVAQAANKALGLLISKVKLNGGVHYKCFTQMFDTFVWPVISYSACIWGTRMYGAIESVFNRACRFFLGLGQHAPVSAIRGDMGVVPPLCRQMKEVARKYSRQKTMSNKRISYMIFNWASNLVGIRDRGWAGRAQKAFVELDTLNVSEQSKASVFIILTRKACQSIEM